MRNRGTLMPRPRRFSRHLLGRNNDFYGAFAQCDAYNFYAAGGFARFAAAADTDVARGAALVAAKDAATADGDRVWAGPRTMDLETGRLDLSRAGAGQIHLRGCGEDRTSIQSQSTPIASGVIIRLGLSGCQVRDLTIDSTLTDGSFQAPIGAAEAAGESAFVDALIEYITIIGDTDGFYISHASVCSAILRHVHSHAKIDSIAMLPAGGGAHDVKAYTCTFHGHGPSSAAGGRARGVAVRTGTLQIFDSDVAAENGGAGAGSETIPILVVSTGTCEMFRGTVTANGDNTNTRGIRVQATGVFTGTDVTISATGSAGISGYGLEVQTGGTGTLLGGSVTSAGDTPLDLVQAGTGVLSVDEDVVYDVDKTSGTITEI